MEKKIGEQNSSQGRQFVMAATFTRKVVAEHNTVNDAWIIVDDKVYDISRWAFSHPGGRVILFYRGQDATEPVYAFHPDMQRTKRFMKPLYVGDLQEDPKDPLAPHVQDFRQLREDLEKEGNMITDRFSFVQSLDFDRDIFCRIFSTKCSFLFVLFATNYLF